MGDGGRPALEGGSQASLQSCLSRWPCHCDGPCPGGHGPLTELLQGEGWLAGSVRPRTFLEDASESFTPRRPELNRSSCALPPNASPHPPHHHSKELVTVPHRPVV